MVGGFGWLSTHHMNLGKQICDVLCLAKVNPILYSMSLNGNEVTKALEVLKSKLFLQPIDERTNTSRMSTSNNNINLYKHKNFNLAVVINE